MSPFRQARRTVEPAEAPTNSQVAANASSHDEILLSREERKKEAMKFGVE